jgi:hypothetical protein
MKLLRQAVAALAMPGPAALDTLDPRCHRPDELALDFDDAFRVIVGNFASDLTSEQLSALQMLDALLEEMSGSHNSHLWTEEAVVSHDRWREVRSRAYTVMGEFGWAAV